MPSQTCCSTPLWRLVKAIVLAAGGAPKPLPPPPEVEMAYAFGYSKPMLNRAFAAPLRTRP